jgi:hypothetical protein
VEDIAVQRKVGERRGGMGWDRRRRDKTRWRRVMHVEMGELRKSPYFAHEFEIGVFLP